MKTFFACLVLLCAMITLPGCGGEGDNSLATDGATAVDYAQYEADLAAANADGAYDDDGDEGEVSEGDAGDGAGDE